MPAKTSELDDLKEDLAFRIRMAKPRLGDVTSRDLLLLYWEIGRELNHFCQKEGDRSEIKTMVGLFLKEQFPTMRGPCMRNLSYSRMLHRIFPMRHEIEAIAGTLPWMIINLIMENIKDPVLLRRVIEDEQKDRTPYRLLRESFRITTGSGKGPRRSRSVPSG